MHVLGLVNVALVALTLSFGRKGRRPIRATRQGPGLEDAILTVGYGVRR